MSPAPRSRPAAPLFGIALGLLVFAGGLAFARAWLPEWRMGEPAPRKVFLERYREMAASLEMAPQGRHPQIDLVTRGPEQLEPYRRLGDAGTGWLLETRTALRVALVQALGERGEAGGIRLMADFSLDGRPEYLAWWAQRWQMFFSPILSSEAPISSALAPHLAAPGERLGARRSDLSAVVPRTLYPLTGGHRPQFLLGFLAARQNGFLLRQPGALSTAALEQADDDFFGLITSVWIHVPWLLALAGLFLVLALLRRLGVVNGALLAALTLASLLGNLAPFGPRLTSLGMAVGWTVWLFLLWSCAESLLRAGAADFTTSLDALRAGRLGPRGGRALLSGFAFGAGLAGLRLGLMALAEILPGAWPARFSVELPVFGPLGNPLALGIHLAGGAALALAIALRAVPVRWAPLAAALAAGLALPAVPVEPWLLGWAANAGFAGVLVWIARRHGLTALLTASIFAYLLPAATLAASYWEWIPGTVAAAASLVLAVPVLGWLGLSRSAAAEVQRLAPPLFVRRLEGERRFRHEMDLLAKMQLGLLPRTLPHLQGYDLAARSLIANEAGGDLYDVLTDDDGYVWIAAGDVAGHGYSCAIAQAMTKSALASLAGRGRTPAEVLQRADRVLRAAGAARNFTSLALLRLRPETGEALLSNAGYPYPLLVDNGQVQEIDLSALPLGLGPPRRYQDRALTLTPGSFLLFCSDGLFEASDGGGRVYGFDRVRDLARELGNRSAERIVELLLADWRRHLRAVEPLDDTTVVVAQRLGGGR